MKILLQPRLSKAQWKLLASAFSNMAQAIVLFAGAAFFVSEAVGLQNTFSKSILLGFLGFGLTVLASAVILAKKGEK